MAVVKVSKKGKDVLEAGVSDIVLHSDYFNFLLYYRGKTFISDCLGTDTLWFDWKYQFTPFVLVYMSPDNGGTPTHNWSLVGYMGGNPWETYGFRFWNFSENIDQLGIFIYNDDYLLDCPRHFAVLVFAIQTKQEGIQDDKLGSYMKISSTGEDVTKVGAGKIIFSSEMQSVQIIEEIYGNYDNTNNLWYAQHNYNKPLLALVEETDTATDDKMLFWVDGITTNQVSINKSFVAPKFLITNIEVYV